MLKESEGNEEEEQGQIIQGIIAKNQSIIHEYSLYQTLKREIYMKTNIQLALPDQS